MLRDRNAPALSGKWGGGGRRADRDNGLIAEVEARVQSATLPSRSKEVRWLNASEWEIRVEMERRLEAYFKRKDEKAA
jgi:hypothetical protein